MALSDETQDALRIRLLNRIGASHHSFAARVSISSRTPDWLTVIADELRLLPRASPRTAWRERVRTEFTVLSAPRRFALFLTRATAFALATVVAIGIASVSFVYETAPTYAEVGTLNIAMGSVKIRPADATFFIEARTGTIVHEGDTLRVETAGKATLALTNTGRLELAAHTEIAIKPQPTTTAIVRQQVVEPTVSVAVLSGSVNAKMENQHDTQTLAIETPSGTVAAPQASEVAVAVDAAGTAEVTTSSDNVALTPLDGALTKELPAGSRALLSATTLLVTDLASPVDIVTTPRPVVVASEHSVQSLTPKPIVETPPPVPDPFLAIATEVDILKTRSFDALAFVESGDLAAAMRAAAAADDALVVLARRADSAFTGDALAARAFLAAESSKHLDDIAQTTFTADLAKLGLLADITRDALANPAQLRGVPEFAIVQRDRYTPTPELRKLFTALSLRNFAASAVQARADTLISLVISGYASGLGSANNHTWTESLIAGMESQPIYLPALREMRVSAPASVRYILDHKIAELEAAYAAYVGAGN